MAVRAVRQVPGNCRVAVDESVASVVYHTPDADEMSCVKNKQGSVHRCALSTVFGWESAYSSLTMRCAVQRMQT